MAYFPTSPINGQVTTINGIAYSYDAGRTVWKRVVNNLGNLTVTGNITSANVSTGNVYISTGVFWANGTAFASFPAALDANVGTLYLGNISTQANIGTLYLGNIATQANIGTLYNTNNTTQANIGTLYLGNIATQANIGTIVLGNAATQANIGAFYTYANANIGTLYLGNLTTQVNLGAYQQYANANIGTLYLGNLSTQVNIGAFHTYANANIGTLYLGNLTTQVNLGAYQQYANANIGTLFLGNNATQSNIGTLYLGNIATQANLGAFQTYSNSNAATQATSINTINANLGAFENYANTKIGTNTNSNLVVVATTTSTSSTTGALVVGGGAGIAGNVYTDKVFTTNGIFWAGNNAPWMAQFTASATPPSFPSLGSYWYKTTTDVVYEYVNDGTNSFWMDITTPPFVANVVTSTYIGDVYAGNITFTGSITGSVGYLLERANVVAYAPPAMTNLDLITSPIIYFTSNSTQNITANIRGNSNVTLNSILAVGQSATFVVFMPNATSYYVSAVKIDNVTVTPFWQGGASIIGGNANSLDVYTFAVLKTANATFKVFASQVKYQNLGP